MTKRQERINELIIRTVHLKQDAEQAEALFREAQDELVSLMEKLDDRTVVVEDELTGKTYSGTLVQSEVLEIDEAGLKKALGAKLWAKVTKQVLDKKKLEACVTTGDISPVIVAANSVEKARRPYVRFTTKQPG